MIDQHKRIGRQASAARDRASATANAMRASWEERSRSVDSMWVRVLLETFSQLKANDVQHMAAGVAYYAVLSLFPLMLGIVAVTGYFVDSHLIRDLLTAFLESYLPPSINLLDHNADELARFSGLFGLVGLIGLFWTASLMLSALTRALNRALGIKERRPFLRQKGREIGVGLTAGLVFLLSLIGYAAIRVLGALELPVVGRMSMLETFGLQIAGVVFSFVLASVSFALIYRLLPTIDLKWKYIWPGAITAALLFQAAQGAFVFYASRYGTYELVYGPIASGVVLLVWSFASAFVVILGAEISAVYARIDTDLAPGSAVKGAAEDTGGEPAVAAAGLGGDTHRDLLER